MQSPRVLLVEDEALIALALADDLEMAGYEVAGPFHRCSDSLDWLGRETPDLAIIDIHLRDGSSAELAEVLRERGVPFIIFSGERRDRQVADAFAGALWLSKPVGTRELLETVGSIVPARAPARPCAMAACGAHAAAL
ncbi:MAG: response regulator [Pseudomonadota bacterium]|nr:response regulator [Pseudomonadota bacterium]